MARKIFTDESLATFIDEIKSYTATEVNTRATKGHGIYYGTCDTAAATTAKVVTLTDATGFSLTTGAVVIVKFTYANGVASPTLNVNSTGAKSIKQYGTTAVPSGGWNAGAVQIFVYDGTNWVRDFWTNTTYTNAGLGQGYATCATAESTVAKVGTLSGYTLLIGGIVSVKFTYAVPASATLNINSTGAKSIYYQGAAITANKILAGDIATFIYNGSQYHLIAIDRWQAEIERCNVEIQNLMGVVDRFTYEPNLPKLTMDGGAAQVICNDDCVEINAPGGLYHDGNEVVTANYTGEVYFGGDISFDGTVTYFQEEIAVKSEIPSYIQTGAKSGTTIGDCATIEGADNTGSAPYAHAEGYGTTASAPSAHAEGQNTTASAPYAHAEGHSTTAAGQYSHAGGYGTIANNYQYVVGKYNTSTTAPTSLTDTTASAGLFIVGIGTSDSARSNGFRVNPAGKVYGTGTFGTTGADYAEYFEWLDGNPNNEDRRGRFVTLEGDKIRYATPNDDYILGVVSADPSVAGDIHSEDWHNRYLKDVFGSKIVEVVEVEETTNEDGEVIPAHIEKRWVLNPDYDPNVEYTSREERPEWAAIGLVGKLVVVDDGTCQVDGYCYPNVNGIATASQERTNYRVMERLDDTHIRIFIR